jgi:hypothetical protein
MGSGKSRSPAADFLPRRSETLRESFQEKMRQKGFHRPGRGAGSRGEIRLLEMVHGPHPEVDRLNDRFLAGAPRLKATFDFLGFEASNGGFSTDLISPLLDSFPRIERHRCCGGNDIHATLFRRGSRNGDGQPASDPGLDLCHLLEHLAMEMMGAMVPGRRCAGITCAYREPAHRFDLFLECDDGRVGAAALRCATQVLLSLFQAGEMPPGAGRYAETVRYFLGRPRSLLNPGEVLSDLQGNPAHLEAALRFLAAAGFLREERFTFDFGETVLYRYCLASALPAVPISFAL